jgi:tRNA A22 N-methylase
MTDKDLKLDARLNAVSSLVRDGVTLYDIGSDHAYLPVSLLLEEKIKAGASYTCDFRENDYVFEEK